MAEEDQEDQEQPLPAAVAIEAAQEKPNQLVSESDDDREITKGSFSSLKLKIPITKPPPPAAAGADDRQFMKEDLLRQREQEQDQQQRGGVLGLLRTCGECGKQFTSGKALGGHKRACLQRIKNGTTHNNQKPRLINNAVAVKLEEAGEENIDNHICYVCQQSFRSVKSLYGHMRKHPEREWRGVQPPKHYLLNHRLHQHPSSTSSPTIHYRLSRDNHDRDHYDDDSYDVDGSTGSGAEDLVESLKGWSAKRKRGQRLIMSSSSDEDEDEDEEEEEAMQQAVSDLLLLAQLSAEDFNDNKERRRTFDQHQVVSSVGSGYGVLKIKDNKKIDDGHDEDDDREKKKVTVEMKDGNELGFDNCNSEDTWIVKEDYEGDEDAGSSEMDDQMMMMMMMMKQQKKNKRRRLNELDDAVPEGTTAGGGALKEEPVVMSTAQTYTCPICNKSFDKHQALGGHVASHNKNKNVKESSSASAAAAAEDSKGEDKLAAAASDEETGESSRILAAAAAAAGCGSSEHKCNICNKIFPTGQALGGHKRCHWTGPAEAFSSSSQVTTSAGEVTQRAPSPSPSRVVHDFDLNDTPPEYYQFHGGEAAAPSAAAATIS